MELIALAAEVAADIVHNALSAVFRLRLTAEHGIGAGIGMVIAAEYEVKTRLFDTGEELRRCGNGLGAVDRLMRHKNLPDAVGSQVFGNVRQCGG